MAPKSRKHVSKVGPNTEAGNHSKNEPTSMLIEANIEPKCHKTTEVCLARFSDASGTIGATEPRG